jgi:hypothetical protein
LFFFTWVIPGLIGRGMILTDGSESFISVSLAITPIASAAPKVDNHASAVTEKYASTRFLPLVDDETTSWSNIRTPPDVGWRPFAGSWSFSDYSGPARAMSGCFATNGTA